ncbi:MAG: T9SS type A sorting domain-containing protein [Ignavibacteriae bacterium]|nr:T9SS type A sorting domain-containing protein [Ignavibacteriota bacterium]
MAGHEAREHRPNLHDVRGPASSGIPGSGSATSPTPLHIPRHFAENRGQWSNAVLYAHQGIRSSMWLRQDGFVFRTSAAVRTVATGAGELRRLDQDVATLTYRFHNPSRHLRVVAERRVQAVYHWYTDPDSTRWRENVPAYERITYRNVWRNIDVVFEGADGALEQRVVLHPGARLRDVAFDVDEEGDARAALRGALAAQPNSRGTAGRQTNPTVRGINSGTPNRRVQLAEMNRTPLRTEYSTYFGGAADETASMIRVDNDGNIILRAWGTNGSGEPLIGNWFAAPFDDYLVKMACDGKTVVFGTYLGWYTGPNMSYNSSNCFCLGPDGSIYLVGSMAKNEHDYPTTANSLLPHPSTTVGSDGRNYSAGVLLRISESGKLLFGTHVYGQSIKNDGASPSVEDMLFAVNTDAAGAVYVSGFAGYSHLPFMARRPDSLGLLSPYSFILHLNAACDTVLHARYFHSGASILNMAVNSRGLLVVSGNIHRTDLPVRAAQQPTNGGGYDLFVAGLDAQLDSIVFCTYHGGSGWDQTSPNAMCLDGDDNIYIQAATASQDFPGIDGYQQTFRGDSAAHSPMYAYDVVVSKLTPLARLMHGTFLGGTREENQQGLALDRVGKVYSYCYTWSRNYPLHNALRDTFGVASYALSILDSGLSRMHISTCWGSADHGYNYGWRPWSSRFSNSTTSLALTDNGYVYLTGHAGVNLPVFNAYKPTLGGRSDVFLTRLYLPFDGQDYVSGVLHMPDTIRVNRSLGLVWPEIFRITAVVTNTHAVKTAHALRVSLQLPPGLVFDPPGQVSSRVVPDLAAGRADSVSWTVRVDTSVSPGNRAIHAEWTFEDASVRQSCPPNAGGTAATLTMLHVPGTPGGEVSCALILPDTVTASALDAATVDVPVHFTMRNTTARPLTVGECGVQLPRGMALRVQPASDTVRGGFVLPAHGSREELWIVSASVRAATRSLGISCVARDTLGALLTYCAGSVTVAGQPLQPCAATGTEVIRFTPSGAALTDTVWARFTVENPLDTARIVESATLDLAQAPHLVPHAGVPPVQGPVSIAPRFRRVFVWPLRAASAPVTTQTDTVRLVLRTPERTGTGPCVHNVALVPLSDVLECALTAPERCTLSSDGRMYEPATYILRCVVRNAGSTRSRAGRVDLHIVPSSVAEIAEALTRVLPPLGMGDSVVFGWSLRPRLLRDPVILSYEVSVYDTVGVETHHCATQTALPGITDDLRCALHTPDTLVYTVARDTYTPDPFTASLALENVLDTSQSAIEVMLDLAQSPHIALVSGESVMKQVTGMGAHATDSVTWHLTVAQPRPSTMVTEQIVARYRVVGDTAWRSCGAALHIGGGERIRAARCTARGHDTVWADMAAERVVPRPLQVLYTIENTGTVPLAACTAAIVAPAPFVLMSDSVQTYGTIDVGASVTRPWLLDVEDDRFVPGRYTLQWAAGCAGVDTAFTCAHTVTLQVGSPPGIVLTPLRLFFAAERGAALPAAQQVQLSTGGGLTMPWTLQSGASWLDVTPTSGDRGSVLRVQPNTTQRAEGVHETRIDLVSTWPLQPPQVEVEYVLSRSTGTSAAPAPADLAVNAVFPHPARGAVSITYTVSRAADATLLLHDALGRVVRTVATGAHAAGRHRATADLSGLAPGLYLAVLHTRGETAVRRVVLR